MSTPTPPAHRYGLPVGLWVAERVNGRYWPEMSHAIGLERHGYLVAGVIYENWNRASISCHIAITGRLTPAYLVEIFHYPFVRTGVNKILAPVSSDNIKSRSLVENMGFAVEASLKDAHPRGDLLIYTLAKADCRFLREDHGKRFQPAASR